ncbi:ATP-binding protein [Streptomyces catenulae]|uniref:ATP-binding protein n=1 Tax=Streptomyces catenulae TaxID=66875 RepID=A0ABV2Z5D1_9ACTN|nr:ATP-binding protein [Streptomyces catenulae]
MRTPPGPPAESPEELTAPPAHHGTWRFTAPLDTASVPRTRHAVRDLLAERRVPLAPAVRDGLLLIVSELVTNAVRHAAHFSPELAVHLDIGDGRLRLAVADLHPYCPKALEADAGDLGGRGLWLVKTVTAEAGGACGVAPTPGGGKIVWVEFPLAARPPAGPSTSPPRLP